MCVDGVGWVDGFLIFWIVLLDFGGPKVCGLKNPWVNLELPCALFAVLLP
jgi:hypothetical protein